jgi:sulfur-oxidizing protein SoxX
MRRATAVWAASVVAVQLATPVLPRASAESASASGDASSRASAARSAATAKLPAGDPVRGRAIVADRQLGLCLLCHRVPIPEARFQGEVGPDLAGVGKRRTTDELRSRLIDPARFNPDTPMPSFARREGQWRVPSALRGQPILTEAQVEDVVAYLGTLR